MLGPSLAAFLGGAAALLLGLLTPHLALAADAWQGKVAGDEINVRSAPSASAPIVGTLQAGQPVTVQQWVLGDAVKGKNDVWAQVGDGRYVYTAGLAKDVPATPPPPPPAPTAGHWIDVNLTQQVATAYEGNKPVYSAVVSTGTVGWESPIGTFPVLRRVQNETMRSSSLRVTVADSYDIPNVLYTQYLTDYGHAIHSNYWKYDSPFGVPTSHGCVGMKEADALFFWNFASVGTPVVMHK